MTNDEIRIKVAEAMGVCHHPKESIRSEEWEDGNDAGTDWTCTLCKKDPHYYPAPNYPADLNACAEFEKALTDDEWNIYSAKIVGLTSWNRATDTVRIILQATAHQRCLAYLKTKGIIP